MSIILQDRTRPSTELQQLRDKAGTTVFLRQSENVLAYLERIIYYLMYTIGLELIQKGRISMI